MRFIATADLQIGMSAHGLGDHRHAFALARIAVIARLGQLARDRSASAIVVAGDLFDRDPVSAGDLARTMDAIAEIALPVLVVPGNHDNDHPGSVWRSPAFLDARPDQLRLLGETPIEIGGVEFRGAPLPTRHPDAPLVERLLDTLPADGAARVVVGHGAVDAVSGDHGSPSTLHLAELERGIAEGRTRLIVLGDRHRPLEVGSTGRIWYPGAPEPTDFGDGPGAALVIDLDADGASTPRVEVVETGTWRFERPRPHLTDVAHVENLLGELEALPHKLTTVVQVRPRGALGTEASRQLEAGLDALVPRFAVLDRRLDDLAIVPELEELERLVLPGYARRVAEELIARVRGAEERGTEDPDAIDELRLLLRHIATVGS